MQNQINTTAISQFAQLLRATELAQQKEVKIPIHQARLLNIALTELLDKINQDYDKLLANLQNNETPNNTNEVITIELDGGLFGD